MTAAILGMTAAVGCASPVAPAYGVPTTESSAITDAGDESNTNDAGVQVEKAPDMTPSPRYGLPPE